MENLLLKSGTVAAALLVAVLGTQGCSPENLPAAMAETCSRAEQALAAGMEEIGFPGAVGAISFGSGEECVFAVGLSDLDGQVPMRPDHRFLAASIGKTFVAAETILLAHEGVLDIDDKVSRWLGDKEGYERIPNADEMTIRNLMSHTAGIPDHVYQPAFAADLSGLDSRDAAIPPWQLVGYIFDTEPLFQPGEGFGYSDTGYILLGLVIEAASGQPFQGLVQRDFLVPLDLDRTTPSTTPNPSNLSQAYIDGERIRMTQKEALDAYGYLNYNAATEWAGGGFVSNPRDLARWSRALFSGKAMPFEYLDLMLEGSPQAGTTEGRSYGLGVSKYPTEFGVAYGHFGWIPGYVSAAFYLPARDASFAFSINTDINLMGGPESNFSRLYDRFIESVFGGM